MAEVDREGKSLDSSRFPLFTDGYYARRVKDGKRPEHGYPANHLPEPAIKELDVRSGYAAALKAEAEALKKDQ